MSDLEEEVMVRNTGNVCSRGGLWATILMVEEVKFLKPHVDANFPTI